MTHDEIEKLVELVSSTRVQSFQLEEAGQRLKAVFGARVQHNGKVNPLDEPAQPKLIVKSPGMGVVRLTHPQQSEPFVIIGRPVKKGEIVAFLEYREVLEGIVSQHDGILAEARVKDGELVGYADAVFELE